jgi:ribosomal protein S18 acetylase RimI-like enzyme
MQPKHLEDALRLLNSDHRLLAFEEWETAMLATHVQNPAARPDVVALVATDRDGRVIGVLLGGVSFRGQINHLVVDPNIRNAGIGSALMTAFEERVLLSGCRRAVLTITAENTAPGGAKGFYNRLGYAKVAGEETLERDLPVG